MRVRIERANLTIDPMKNLRNYFIVDELQSAALNNDELRLKTVRRLIERIKLAQLDKQQIADNKMIIAELENHREALVEELALIDQYIKMAKDD